MEAIIFKDSFNRQIDYLRISITDRCSLQCIYCVPEKGVTRFQPRDILRFDEIVRIVRIAAKNGVRKVRLTGGEPLMRDDIVEIVSAVKGAGIQDVSITTNGMKLAAMSRDLKKAGLDRVNISLDTLDPERYNKITRGGDIERVWDAIGEAERVGFRPIKINVVPIRGVNDDEVARFAELTRTKDYHIRFIEFMPVKANGEWKPEACVKTDEIMERVARLGKLERLQFKGGGPSRNYRIEGAVGVVGFISPISDCFCESCNRLRLTSVGILRPCLFSDVSVDVRTPLRNGISDEELEKIYRGAVLAKPESHQLNKETRVCEGMPTMSQVGG